MRLPSLRFIIDQALETFSRFPFAVLSAVAGTGAMLVLAQEEFRDYGEVSWLFNAASVAFLGISLLTLTQLWAERVSMSFGRWLVFHLAISGILLFYYLLLPENMYQAPSHHVIRFWLFMAAAHFFVAAGPFIGSGTVEGFWEFNKALFLRFLSAFLYSGVLFAGLSVALVAVDNLFDANIAGKRYLQLWWFLAGIFNTWFFLSGVPKSLKDLDASLRYPNGLKIFAQYVLVPLVAIYLAILYAYMTKIIVEWNWPEGWVGYLVLGFSTSGILTLLLLHPIKDALNNRWMAVITRNFYIVILPPAVLLLLAIWRRISEYGLTENRYFVVVLGVWLIGISLYFLLSRRKSIKVIPLTLGTIALVASTGPWSAPSVSLMNQIGRLEAVLTSRGILVDNTIIPTKSAVTFEDARRVSSIIRYVLDVHGWGHLQPWFTVSLDTMRGDEERRFRSDLHARSIVSFLGIDYVSEWERVRSSTSKYLTFGPKSTTLDIRGFDFVHGTEHLSGDDRDVSFSAAGTSWRVTLEKDSSVLAVRSSRGGAEGGTERIEFPIGDLLENLARTHPEEYVENKVTADSLLLRGDLRGNQVGIFLRKVEARRDSTGVRVTSLDLDVLVRTK